MANSDASSLVGGWSFRKDNLSRSLSHFVSLWDGDPTSIDRRNPEAPEERASSRFARSATPPSRAKKSWPSCICAWLYRCQFRG